MVQSKKKVMASLKEKIKKKMCSCMRSAVRDAGLKFLNEGDELTFDL